MKYRAQLIILLLIFPSTLVAKTFIGLSKPFSSTVSYTDDDVSNVELSSKFDLDLLNESNLGFEVMFGDLERGDEFRNGGEIRNINLEGQNGTTKYLFESKEYLIKAGGVAAQAERAWNFGIFAYGFIGLGSLNYQFEKIDENRISVKAEKADEFNYTPIGGEIGLEVYITNGIFISGKIRRYVNEIKIKYLPNPDGSESTGTFKNHTSTNLTIGGYF
jgi:hypothetical protein